MRSFILLFLTIISAYSQPTFVGGDLLGFPVGSVRPLGSAQNKTGGNSIALNATIFPGETIIAMVSHDSNGVLTNGSFNVENFTLDVTNRVGTTAATISCGIMSLITTQYNTALDIRATFNSAVAALAITGYAVRGRLTLDQFSTNSGTGTTPSSNAAGLITQANEFLVSVVALEGPNTDAVGVWNSAIIDGQKNGTSGGGDASNVSITDGYLLISSPGRSNLGSKTGMANRDWAAGVALYKFK